MDTTEWMWRGGRRFEGMESVNDPLNVIRLGQHTPTRTRRQLGGESLAKERNGEASQECVRWWRSTKWRIVERARMRGLLGATQLIAPEALGLRCWRQAAQYVGDGMGPVPIVKPSRRSRKQQVCVCVWAQVADLCAYVNVPVCVCICMCVCRCSCRQPTRHTGNFFRRLSSNVVVPLHYCGDRNATNKVRDAGQWMCWTLCRNGFSR